MATLPEAPPRCLEPDTRGVCVYVYRLVWVFEITRQRFQSDFPVADDFWEVADEAQMGSIHRS